MRTSVAAFLLLFFSATFVSIVYELKDFQCGILGEGGRGGGGGNELCFDFVQFLPDGRFLVPSSTLLALEGLSFFSSRLLEPPKGAQTRKECLLSKIMER